MKLFKYEIAGSTRKVVQACCLALAAGVWIGSLGASTALAQTPGAPAPKRGGTLTIQLSGLTGINNAIQSAYQAMSVGPQLFAGLVEYGTDWKPEPYLADSWEVSSDGLFYTFKLNPNAVFHDGQPVTSSDVAFSIETVKANHPFGVGMFGAVSRIDTPDPKTAVIVLSRPSPGLIYALAPHFTPILPRHVYGTGAIRQNPLVQKPVGSGPFRFVEFKPNEIAVVERFDRFFRPGLPYLDRIVFKSMEDPSIVSLALARGEVDASIYSQLTFGHLKRLRGEPALVVTDAGHEGIGALFWLEFNVRKPPLNDVKVRQAISYAFDRNFITGKLHGGMTRPIYGPISTTSPFFVTDLKRYDLDLKRAAQLLDEAGYKPGPDGKRFTLRLDWAPFARDMYQITAEYLTPQLKKVGIDVVLRPSSGWATWSKRIADWDFDMNVSSAYNWGDPTVGVDRTYLSSNIRHLIYANTAGYSNPRVDELLIQAGAENNPAKRRTFYAEFQRILNEEVPLAFMFQSPIYTVYNKRVHNLPMGIWGTTAPYDQVWVDAK